MAWDVRPTANLDEFTDALGAIFHYFGQGESNLEHVERFSCALPFERMHAAFDGDRIVGGAGAFPFEFSIPGGTIQCAGITLVGVLPTHRRRGVLTAMMRAQLEDIRSCGEPIAALWASEETIYGRFGYGLASLTGEIALPRTHGFLREDADPGAHAKLISLERAKQLLPPIYDRVRLETPGMFGRTPAWWEARILADPPERREGAGAKIAVMLELDGRDAGYALYRVTPKFDGGLSVGETRVLEAMGDSPTAVRELWRFLLELDWMATVRASMLPIDHPLWLILRNPRRMKMRVGDSLWCRLVDVGAALSARSYAAHDEIVFEVADTFLPENEGRWRLAGGEAARTDAEADLELNVTELGSVYLGGFTFAELQRAGLVRELRSGAVERADAVFATGVKPWCPEIF